MMRMALRWGLWVEELDLTTSVRTLGERKRRGRRSAGGIALPFRQIAELGTIRALVVYFARHPKALAQAVVVAAIGAAGALAFWSFQQARSSFVQKEPEPTVRESRPIPGLVPERLAPIQKPTAPPVQETRLTAGSAPAVPAPKPRFDESAAPAKLIRPKNISRLLGEPAIDEWLAGAYLRCWTQPPTPPRSEKYAAQIRVSHTPDGALAGAPVLVNPPDDPSWRAFAESALQAVKKCSPLQVPAKYAGRYEQWRKVTLHFSPDDARD
jgi:hypothetical protein